MARTARVLLFATAREAAGTNEIDWPVPEEGIPISELLAALTDRFPRLRAVSAHSRFLVNSEYVRGLKGKIRPGDEFAIHPPYSGG